MGYTNIREKRKWQDPHTKKAKYGSSDKFDDNENKFGKGWSPGYALTNGANFSSFTTLKLISQTNLHQRWYICGNSKIHTRWYSH